MKTDTLLVVGLAGAAAVLVAKAMGFNVQSVTGTGKTNAASFAQSLWKPFAPIGGTSYNPANPGAYIPNSQLINGTIRDYYQGNTASYNTPTINETVSDVLASYYGTTGTKSIVHNPNVWW